MNSAFLEIDGMRSTAEVLSIIRMEEQSRSVITVRSGERLSRGRTCHLHFSTGRTLDCVISNVIDSGNVYIVELRCIEDASDLRP